MRLDHKKDISDCSLFKIVGGRLPPPGYETACRLERFTRFSWQRLEDKTHEAGDLFPSAKK
jgi:hypothetical protein